MFKKNNPYQLTVVIATLGGETLTSTIKYLNEGVIVPDEILICIPKEESSNLEDKIGENVKVIITSCRGQVAQRAIGFANATHPLVMQIDDDVIVDKHCIEFLVKTIKLYGSDTSVSPALINISNNESFYQMPKNILLLKIYYWILNGVQGYRPGCITRAGTNVGVDHKIFDSKIINVEWLPGGCVLHNKKNLILENFYPYKGKAYSEDLFHSYYLKNKNIQLMVCTEAQCYINNDDIIGNYSFKEFVNYIKADFRARNNFIKLESKSLLRMYIFYFIFIIRNIARRLKF
jgi:hypothetical protein